MWSECNLTWDRIVGVIATGCGAGRVKRFSRNWGKILKLEFPESREENFLDYKHFLLFNFA